MFINNLQFCISISIIYNCYYKIDYMQQDVITSWVCSNTSLYCSNLLRLQNCTYTICIMNNLILIVKFLVTQSLGKFHNMYIEATLSRVINRLTSDLIKNQSAVVVVSYIF